MSLIEIKKIIQAIETDGAGVKLKRSIGTQKQIILILFSCLMNLDQKIKMIT